MKFIAVAPSNQKFDRQQAMKELLLTTLDICGPLMDEKLNLSLQPIKNRKLSFKKSITWYYRSRE